VLKLATGNDPAARQRLLQNIIPLATYRHRTRFLKLDESERTERLARVIAAAIYVWNGDKQGAREVEDILGSLFYGLAA
jgi:uncharacterized protein (DUF2384 family)